MQSQGKKNKQQPVKEVGGCVRMIVRRQKKGEVEGRLVCSFEAPHPVSKHASSSHNTRLVGGGVAPRGWWHIVAKLLQCLQFPAWEQPLSPAWGRLRFPAWEHLPVPCLSMFAVPAWDALPVPCLGTFANALPGNVCQCPAWEHHLLGRRP